jgi:F-type H+-transporting ATPase subunit b
MTMKFRPTAVAVALSAICFFGVANAQQAPAGAVSQTPAATQTSPAAPAQPREQNAEPIRETPAGAPEVGPEHPEQQKGPGFGRELAKESKEAAGEEDETKTFKLSPSVHKLAQITGLSPEKASWLGIILNFVILALLLWFGMRKSIPAAFKARTESIRKGIEEGQRASADANRRLADVEARLSRLSEEIASMRTAAEKEAAAEEARIMAAAEEDKKKIVESAQFEIEAAGKAARRELKAYAAELAVTLAEKRIHVDPSADQALVRSFTQQLGATGKDGQ